MEVVKKNHTDYILSLSGKSEIDENELYNVLESEDEDIIDWKSVYTHYEKSDNAIGLFLKGYMYYHGYELVMNDDKAKKLFELAIEKGSINSLYYMGLIYYHVTRYANITKAYVYFIKAINGGIIGVNYDVGCMLSCMIDEGEYIDIDDPELRSPEIYSKYESEYDGENMLKHFAIAGKNGNIDAVVKLGEYYSDYGEHWVNISKAIEYYILAIEMGNDDAICMVADLYRDCGKYIEAIKYYELAIEKGIDGAACAIGDIYCNKEYKIYDLLKACEYYEIDACKQNSEAINKSIKFYYEYKNNKHCQSLFFKYLDLKKKQDSFDKFKYYFIENNVDKICVRYIEYFMTNYKYKHEYKKVNIFL